MKVSRLIVIVLIVIGGTVSAVSQDLAESSDLNKQVEIISQPRALYPDKARKKGIEGSVTLKITLLSNGTVGTITDATKKNRKKLAKYGFIESAVDAAQRITFRPKVRNGDPVSVIVTRIYMFTVY